MIHSRMVLGMKHYERAYPHTDIILIEPDHHDPELYLANTFSYAQRRHLAEHAYQQTRAMLRKDTGDIAAKLERSGVRIDRVAVNDLGKRLIRPDSTGIAATAMPVATAVQSLHTTLSQLGNLLEPHTTAPPLRRAASRSRRSPSR